VGFRVERWREVVWRVVEEWIEGVKEGRVGEGGD